MNLVNNSVIGEPSDTSEPHKSSEPIDSCDISKRTESGDLEALV